MESLTEAQLKTISAGECPDCGGRLLLGPRGKASQNAMCKSCETTFNTYGILMGRRINQPNRAEGRLQMKKSKKHQKGQRQKVAAREKKLKLGSLKELANVPIETEEAAPATAPAPLSPYLKPLPEQDEAPVETALPAPVPTEPFDAKKMIADLLKKHQEE